MIAKPLARLVATASLILWAGTAFGQEGDSKLTREDLDKIGKIVREEIDAVSKKLDDRLLGLETAQSTTDTRLQQMESIVQSLHQDVAKLKEDTVELENVWTDVDRDLKSIVERDSDGGVFPSVRSIMATEQGRGQFSDAVHRSIRTSGTVIVQNNMSSGYTVRVNGRDEFVPALQSRTVPVPVGTATTELVGYENPRNWKIGAPNYTQKIEINPRPSDRVVVNRPVVGSSVVVERPVVVQRPVVVETPVVSWGYWSYDPFWGWTWIP